MRQIENLWQERMQAYTKELRRYFKYMFNDHLLFVLIFGGGQLFIIIRNGSIHLLRVSQSGLSWV